MTAPRLRLTVAAILFTCWLGWLAYLAATTRNPVVLSRPQFLVSSAHVIATLKGTDEAPDNTVTIQKVVWAPGKQTLAEGETISIDLLELCGRDQGWSGPGDYILPLARTANGYQITLTPPSPGYPPSKDFPVEMRLRIYPLSPQTSQQLKQLQSD